ncbi:MAG TPA: SurA N-terminal domain-containing protein [Solirubrobacterales bacterium]|jgi:parvulin-like peptidyl-prolyl isomerase
MVLVFGAAVVILFVVVAIAEGLGDPSIPSGDVALVQDAPEDTGKISEKQFDRALEQTAAQAGEKKTPKPGDEKYDELKEAALNSILDMVWIQGQADEMGISVTDKEVSEELKKLKKENFKTEAEYKKFLKQSKYTKADVNERVKLQILGTQVQEQITEGVGEPSKDEIENYYEAAKPLQFTQKATRDVRLVGNKDKKKVEQAKAILEKDNSATNWKKVAKKYSEDPSKSQGGLQKGLAEGSAEEPLNEVIFETPENQLTGPIKTPRFYYIFEVEGSTPENVQELSEVESQIKSQLEQQAQQEAFSAFVANYTARWRSRTFCASGFEIERCDNFQAPAHPATAPPACFEANPKEPPEACPAPVFQLVPALPGTVTPVEPRGKPMAQRPIPAVTGSAEEAPPTSLPLPTSP